MTTHAEACSLSARRNDDALCRDLIGVLEAITSSLDALEQCAGCGQRTDPDQPCPTCAARRRRRTA